MTDTAQRIANHYLPAEYALGGRIVANRDAVAGEYILGVNEASSIRNLANPALPMLVLGTPTYNSDHAVVRPGASGYGFDTQLRPYNGRTLIMIRQNGSIAAADTIFGQAGNAFSGLRQFGSNNYMGNHEGASNQGANRAKPSNGVWYFEAAVNVFLGAGRGYHADGSGVIQELTSANNATNQYRSLTGTLRIGTVDLTGGGSTTFPVLYAALIQRPIGLVEMQAIYDAAKAYFLATRNLTIA